MLPPLCIALSAPDGYVLSFRCPSRVPDLSEKAISPAADGVGTLCPSDAATTSGGDIISRGATRNVVNP